MKAEGLVKLNLRKFKLWKQLVYIGSFIRGSKVILKRPCIYKGCKKCKSGVRHPTTYYSISRKNKTTLIYLPKFIQNEVKQLIINYRKLLSIIDELSEINIEIIKTKIKEGKKNGATGSK